MNYRVGAVVLSIALGAGYVVQTELRIRSHERELRALTVVAAAMSTIDLRWGLSDCEPPAWHDLTHANQHAKNRPEWCGALEREMNSRTERMQLVIPQAPLMIEYEPAPHG